MPRPELRRGCHAIVLAAGAGERFGGSKLLASFRERPLVTWAVQAALGTVVESVTVVLGSGTAQLSQALGNLTDDRLHLAQAATWSEGLSASLRCGLANIPVDARAALIFLADMPNVSTALGDKALQTVLDGAPAAFPVFGGIPGHPVAISKELFPALHKLEGDQGARSILCGLRNVVRIVADDAGCIQDVDTRDDLLELD